MKYTLQMYNDNLPIAKPDFDYDFKRKNGGCEFIFYWLPCDQSFHCKNTKPGSEFSFEFRYE